MQDRVMSLLGLAARAGKIVSGGFSAEDAVRKKKAFLVLIAEDTQANTVKKFTDKCSYYKIPLRYYGTKEALGHAVGREERACVAVIDRGFAESILDKLQQTTGGNSG